MTTERIRIAIQNKGRLTENSIELLEKCGIEVLRQGRQSLYQATSDLPADIVLLRDDDIPGFVDNGFCDLGIIGQNVYEETRRGTIGYSATVVEPLGFSPCRFVIAVSKDSNYTCLSDLEGKTIATSYPNLLQDLLDEKAVTATPLYMGGSVEAAPSLGVAEAVYDITESGQSLRDNGLKEIVSGFRSEALLIATPKTMSPEKQKVMDALIERVRDVLYGENDTSIRPIPTRGYNPPERVFAVAAAG